MKQKIAICVALAVVLQSSLRAFWESSAYVDLPLVVVVYFALRRDPLQAVVIGAVAGLGTDAFSSGLLGANGFSKTLVAYLIAAVVTRVLLDNPLLRIPVLAGAVLVEGLIYMLLHRLFGQGPLEAFGETLAYKVIGTTVAGTVIIYVLDIFVSEHGSQRRQFALRRRVARRSLGRRKY
jgi:rod shape-determining protein MreD